MQQKFPQNHFVAPKWGRGKRLVVAEAPGESEHWAGEPLVGSSGKLFDSLCSKAGVSRDELTLANTICCRPPGNVYPTASDARSYISKEDGDSAVAHCSQSHLRPVLEGRDWQRIDVLGDRALSVVTGRKGIYNNRGMILPYAERDVVVPTLHPAALMRDQAFIPVVISDLKKSLVQPPEHYLPYPSLPEVASFKSKVLCFDIENNKWTGEVYMVGITDRNYHAMCVPWKGEYKRELQRIFTEAEVLIGQNIISHDLPHLKRAGLELRSDYQIWDTMLMHHLVSPDLPHDLEFIASLFTNKKAWKHAMAEDKELYCCRDTDVTMQIFPQLRALLRQFDLLDLYHLVSVPVARVCKYLHETGIRIDGNKIGEVRKGLKAKSLELEAKLPEHLRTQQVPVKRRVLAPPGTLSAKTGNKLKYIKVDSSEELVPWRSDKILGAWLYETLKLPVQKHVKTGEKTTDKIALDKLARLAKTPEDKAAIESVRKLRSIDETLTTFAKEKMAYGTSIHTRFNTHGTNSGRLSSSDPNLQNIPEPSRCIYVPRRPESSIVQCDFSSIENRITAWLAGDTERLERFNQPDFSEHKWAVEKFYGVPMGEVKKSSDPDSYYSKAKHIVHGSNYGLGARKMSIMYSIPEKEVKKLQADWKAAIPKTVRWQEEASELAKSQGYLANAFKRRRWFYTSSWYTESLSFLPQSTAADIMLRCMIGLMYDRIGWSRDAALKVCGHVEPLPEWAELLLTVHDALVVECPTAKVDEVVAVLRRVMEQPWRELGGFSCPIAVECGPSWGELEKYKGAA